MKTLRIILVPVLLFLIVSAAVIDQQDNEQQKKAVMAAIEEETAAWYASDPVRYSAAYLNNEDFTVMSSSKGGYSLRTGWDKVIAESSIANKRKLIKEVKTPVKIRVYPESAWVVYKNESFNNDGEITNIQLVTAFLEKVDGNWKIAYRNVINPLSYCQLDIMVIAAINQAKLCGKSPEEAGNMGGDMVKTSWNKEGGYKTFASNSIFNWRNMCPPDGFQIIEQDDNHAVFSACKTLTNLRKSGQMYGITFDEYLAYYKGAYDKVADYMGAIYKQEIIPDGVKITISRK